MTGFFDIKACRLCPRGCLADRTKGTGLCGGGGSVKIARAALHFWEEPCISGARGSGAVFFSGCPLKCRFCQNYEISSGNFGKEITPARLSEIFLGLQAQGAHNINLVTPTHYVPWIIEALDGVKKKLKIPVVYNCGGYESSETLRALCGYIDVYLPDLKYKDPVLSERYSGAADYFKAASEAVLEMFNQTGAAVFDDSGLIKKGVIIRHLVLPGAYRDSIDILNWIAENFRAEDILVSVMRQYTPLKHGAPYPELKRAITTFEYEKVAAAAAKLKLSGYIQDKGSALGSFTPKFDLTGV